MKILKSILLMLLAVVFVSSCDKDAVNEKSPQQTTQKTVSTTAATSVQTFVGGVSNEPNEAIKGGWDMMELKFAFNNVSDFYTFVETDSRDPENYEDPFVKERIAWFWNIDSDKLIKIEQLFNDENIIKNVESVGSAIQEIHNSYAYRLKTESNQVIEVDIKYDQSYDEERWERSWRINNDELIEENDSNEFIFNETPDKIYLKTVDGVRIARSYEKLVTGRYHFDLRVFYNGFMISIVSYFETKEDTEESLVNDFFSSSETKFIADLFNKETDEKAINEFVKNLKESVQPAKS